MRWLVGGNVFDVEKGKFQRSDIGIDGERIAAITPQAKPDRKDEVHEMPGAWLLPGLIDCHVHLTIPTELADPAAGANRTDAAVALYTAKAAERTLQAGVTTARDVGGWNYVEMAVRDAINQGLATGPRLFLAGRLLSITTQTVDYYPGMYEVADGPDAVKQAARKQLAKGADLIKVMATGAMLSSENEDARAIQFTLEELKAAVEIAHDNFKHVAAHAHACRGIENCIDAGVDSIEHCTFADEAALRRIAEKGIYIVPTICAGELLIRDNSMVQSMPEHLRKRMLEFNDIHIETIKRAHKMGARIAMGTDAGTPGNHHGMNASECVFMVRDAGMTPAESIHAATINPARLLRQEKNLGSLEAGKFADVIACRGNPLDDIEELTRIALVMKGGQVYKNELWRE
ncbi:MAG TPA: amidohydrolase family protein [Verrucomicrobiae bacterium]|nr:amidohydrolase family protein [Verrucomicrobiae bacterium]